MNNNTAKVLNLRPQRDTKNMELFKAIHRAQHVQRNFDLIKKMPEQDIATIISAATECTSKQNIAQYKLHAITNREVIEEIYKCTKYIPKEDVNVDQTGYINGHNQAKGAGRFSDQPQVLGNLVLVFEDYDNFRNFNFSEKQWAKIEYRVKHYVEGINLMPCIETFVGEVEYLRPFLESLSEWEKATPNQKKKVKIVAKILDIMEVDYHNKDELDNYIKTTHSTLEGDKFTALGVAAGTINLTASLLGYGTGCCSCIHDKLKLKKILGMKNYPMLIMGIGFKQEGKNRRVHHKNDQYMFGTIKKQPIQINYVY